MLMLCCFICTCSSFWFFALFLSLSLCREGPTLSTTRPIQKTLSRQDSQYSEDLDNVMNSKLATRPLVPLDPHRPSSHSTPHSSLLSLVSSTQGSHLAPTTTKGSFILTNPASTTINLVHLDAKPDYTAIDMPSLFPSANAILQGEQRIERDIGEYKSVQILYVKSFICLLIEDLTIMLTKLQHCSENKKLSKMYMS